MKKIFFSILFCLLVIGIQAQNDENTNDNLTKFTPKPANYGLEMGSNFSAGNGNMFSSYIAPHMSYQLSSKWRISGGMIFMNSNISNANIGIKNDAFVKGDFKSMQTFIYSQAEYRHSQKLKFTGEVIYGLNNNKSSGFNSKNQNFSSYTIGAEYKITDGLQIGIQIKSVQGYNPYRFQPYQSNLFGY